MLSVFHHYVFWTHARTHKPTRFCLHFKIRWHFSTDLLLIVNEMYSRNINIINSVLEKRSFFFSLFKSFWKILYHSGGKRMLNVAEVSVNWCTVQKRDWQKTQVSGGDRAADSWSQTSAWSVHRSTLPADRGCFGFVYWSFVSASTGIAMEVMLYAASFSTFRESLSEEKIFQNFCASVRNRNGYSSHCWWYLATGNWTQSQRWKEWSNKWMKKNDSFFFPWYHHKWPNSYVFWYFFNSLCYSFSISGHKCCHATKLAILSGTVRTWPCQALHVLDRKQWTRFSSSFPFC